MPQNSRTSPVFQIGNESFGLFIDNCTTETRGRDSPLKYTEESGFADEAYVR